MARTTRKNLQLQVKQALGALDRCDTYLFAMNEMAEGRQPAIEALAPLLIEAHEQTRKLWKALYTQL